MKAGEKPLFKEMNKDVGIKFPIKVDVALPAHKVSLLIQTELGGVEFPAIDAYKKYRQQYQQDKGVVFQHVNRLSRCIIDCQLKLQDSVSARHALELGRSLAARVWDNSPLELKQLEQIGNIAVRKLAGAGINSMEILENTEAHRIEAILQKNPPFGMKILSKLAEFPKLRVTVKQIGKESKVTDHVEVQLKVVIGFINEEVPLLFHEKPVYVCFLAETSNGGIVDFRRMHAKQIQGEHEILIPANLMKPTAYIACHVMCDEVAGTYRTAEVKLDHIPQRLFPSDKTSKHDGERAKTSGKSPKIRNIKTAGQGSETADDFGDGGLDDGDLLAAEDLETIQVMDIDNLFEEDGNDRQTKRVRTSSDDTGRKFKRRTREQSSEKPVRLENGKWPCNHTCKRESKECRHKCCNEGLDRPRKPPKKVANQDSEDGTAISGIASSNQKKHRNPFDAAHSASEERRHGQEDRVAQEARKPEKSHKVIGTSDAISSVSMVEQRGYLKEKETPSAFEQSFAENPNGLSSLYKTEYLDDYEFEDLPMPKELFGDSPDIANLEVSQDEDDKNHSDPVDKDLELDENDMFSLEAGMVGLEDSLMLANGGDGFAFETGVPSILGDCHATSETIDNYRSSKVQGSLASNFLNAEEDMGFFETPLTLVEPQSLQKRSIYKNEGFVPTSSVLSQSPGNSLLITGDSSSPYKCMPQGDETGQKRTLVVTGIFEDEQELITPLAGKAKSDVETPSANRPLSMPLQDVTKTHGNFQGTTPATQEDIRSAKDQVAKPQQESYEEKQKRLWADIDPAIYEEFHDYVELVED